MILRDLRLIGGWAEEAQSNVFLNMFYVYCLESQKNKKLYIGFTADLKRRFEEHNNKTGSDFTTKNGPWKLIFYEAHINEQDARKIELFYKSGYGREVLHDKIKNYLNLHSGVV